MKSSAVTKIFLITAVIIIITACAPVSFSAQGYVFSYGINDYNIDLEPNIGYLRDLTYTDDDARAVYSLFSAEGYETHLRLNNGGEIYDGKAAKPASKEQLLDDINYISERMTDRDTAVFFFSGHGGSILTADSSDENEPVNPLWTPTLISTPGIAVDDWFFLYSENNVDISEMEDYFLSDNTLGLLLESITKGKIVVLFDACNSGGFIGDSQYIDMWSDPYYIYGEDSYTSPSLSDLISSWNHDLSDYDVKADTALVLAASGEYEYSWEGAEVGHGIFTYYLLRTPDYGDIDGDGFVTLFEMYEYISYKIDANWNEVVNGSSSFHPRITGSPIDFILF